jgi:formamidopyrimidine-DNA glycosylase
MSGRLYLCRSQARPEPYERLRFLLEGGRALVFADTRKFGRLQFVREGVAVLGDLGPEPLSRQFTARWLAGALGARRRLLKPLLLDQRVIAGLGNIYVDETLHRAALHPLARSDRLDRAAVDRLHSAIRHVLRGAIRREGSSFDAFYRTPEGQPGRYQERFHVYGRAGQPCRRCGATIARLVVGQRGTHLCPRCQRRGRVRGPKSG